MRILLLNKQLPVDVYTRMSCKFKISGTDSRYKELIHIKAYNFECELPNAINPYSSVGQIWYDNNKSYEFTVDKNKNIIKTDSIIFNDNETLNELIETACK